MTYEDLLTAYNGQKNTIEVLERVIENRNKLVMGQKLYIKTLKAERTHTQIDEFNKIMAFNGMEAK